MTAQMNQLIVRVNEKESESKVLHAMTKTQGRQLNDAEDTIRDLRRQHADETACLQAELQDVRFEKNSLKEEITNTGEFKKLHETVDKLQHMIMLKQEKTFNEREVSTFKQLFGVTDGPDFSAIARQSQGKGRGTFREADSEHNEAMLNTMMPRKNNKSILTMKSVDALPRSSVDTLPLPR